MSYWQGVRLLIKTDIRNASWKNLLFLGFVAYILLFTNREMITIIRGTTLDKLSIFMTDYLYFMLFSVSGLLTTHKYGLGLKKDLLAEKLAYWRTLPIKVDQIIYCRVISVTLYILLAMISYTVLMGFIMIMQDISFDILPFAIHTFICFSLVLIMNLYYLYLEMTKSVKIYMIYCWIIPLIILVIVSLYVIFTEFSLLAALFDAAKAEPLLMSCASFILTIAGLLLAIRIIDKKVRMRNIL